MLCISFLKPTVEKLRCLTKMHCLSLRSHCLLIHCSVWRTRVPVITPTVWCEFSLEFNFIDLPIFLGVWPKQIFMNLDFRLLPLAGFYLWYLRGRSSPPQKKYCYPYSIQMLKMHQIASQCIFISKNFWRGGGDMSWTP